MFTLFLARHGETDWNREGRWQGQTDIELNALGRAQAAALGDSLVGRGITRVVASDLVRAFETAQIAARALGLSEVTPDRDFRERNFGIFEGLTFADCERKYPEMWARYHTEKIRPEGAETDEQLVLRFRRGIEHLVSGGGTPLLVTHGGSLRSFFRFMQIEGMSPDDFGFPNGAAVEAQIERDPERGLWICGVPKRVAGSGGPR